MSEEKTKKPYDDIINLPHHQSKKRPHMSLHDRAAQFSPFAALTGYDAKVKETARLTNKRLDLSEEVKSDLSAKLTLLQECQDQHPEIEITYFLQDTKKSGGEYVTETSRLKKIDDVQRIVILENQTRIAIDDIAIIISAVFGNENMAE